MKWLFLVVVVCSASLAAAGCKSCEYAGPDSPAAQPAWLAGLQKVRSDVRSQIGYNASIYAVPELAWTQTSYMQPQMHPYDRFFYDPEQGYTVDRYLDDLKDRYGGVDSILMWPTYTNIGTDDRNQFDLFRCMPGGLEGVRNATLQLQARGVRVLWPYNPWDTGTHREPLSDEDTFAKLLKQTNGDGFNGDTMGFVPESFYTSALKADYPLAFEPEGGGTDAALNWATMGWGYWDYGRSPGVDRQKFLTRGKFMLNICNRWAQSKTDDVQNAWFNGCGYESWENVWGTWNGKCPSPTGTLRCLHPEALICVHPSHSPHSCAPSPLRSSLLCFFLQELSRATARRFGGSAQCFVSLAAKRRTPRPSRLLLAISCTASCGSRTTQAPCSRACILRASRCSTTRATTCTRW